MLKKTIETTYDLKVISKFKLEVFLFQPPCSWASPLCILVFLEN